MNNGMEKVKAYSVALVLGGALVFSTLAYRRHRDAVRRNDFARRYTDRLRQTKGADVSVASSEGIRHLSARHAGDPSSSADLFGTEGALVKVVYGSESGTAEGLATDLVRHLNDRQVSACLIDPCRWSYLDRYLYRRTTAESLPTPFLCSKPPSKHVPLPQKEIFIFIVATTGEGEPPTNFYSLYFEVKRTVEAAQKSSGSEELMPFRNMCFSVFGLGDSSYTHFCKCGSSLRELLLLGGGTELVRMGVGDARTESTEDMFDLWQDKLQTALEKRCLLSFHEANAVAPQPQCEWRMVAPPIAASPCAPQDAPPAPPPFSSPAAGMPASFHHPVKIPLVERAQLTPWRASDKSALFRLTFQVGGGAASGAPLRYEAGDHLGIFPANAPAVVQRCAMLLSLSEADLGSFVELGSAKSSRNTLPARVPLRDVLTWYVDLCGRPRRSVLRILAKSCSVESEKKAFLSHLRPVNEHHEEGGGTPPPLHDEEGHEAVAAPWDTILDYMEMFPSCCRIGIGHFVEIMPRVQVRYYSIASDQLSHGDYMDIYVRAPPNGLAGQYLCSRVDVGGSVYAFVRPSHSHLPRPTSHGSSQRENSQVWLIGPGTGAAPFIGFLYRREALLRKKPTQPQPKCTLFFGCQSSAEFYLEEEGRRWVLPPTELRAYDEAHPQTHASLAARNSGGAATLLPEPVLHSLQHVYSREQVSGETSPRYVMDLIQANGAPLYRSMTREKDSRIFVSGDAKEMANDVDKAIVEVLRVHGNMSLEAATELLHRWEEEHRYVKDVY